MTKLERIGAVLSENGCNGPCAHGTCLEEKECDECRLDPDSWCLVCAIAAIVKDSDEDDNATNK